MPRIPLNDESPNDFAKYTKESWRNQDAFYSYWVGRWRRTIDFIRGLHWRVLAEIDDKKIPQWRRFPMVNITLALFNDYLSQWLQSRVRFSVVPDRAEPKKIAQAELGDQVLRSIWDLVELDAKKIDLGSWLLSTGNANLRVFWNTSTGNMLPLAVPEKTEQGIFTGNLIPVNPQTLQPDPTMQAPIMVDAGEIGVEVVSPQLVRWGQTPAHGCMVGYLLSFDDAVERFGEDVANTLKYSTLGGSLAVDLLSVPTNSLATSRSIPSDSALVIEHYLPRSNRFPEGVWWTSSEDRTIIEPETLPARHIPVVDFRWIPMQGHSHLGLTPLYDLTFLNKNIDEMLARAMEWLNKVVPKMILKSGGGIAVGEMTDEPGQEIVANAGGEPSYTAMPSPPNVFSALREELMSAVLFVGGYRTQKPKELPPGEATQRFRQPAQFLNEGQQVALAQINSKPAWKKMGYILLDYVAKFYGEDRAISLVGADHTYMWREFKGSELQNFSATLHVDELPLYPWNRQSQRDTVISVLNSPAGSILFSGPDGQPDRERIEAALEATGLDVSPGLIDPDTTEARNENHVFSNLGEQDQPLPVEPWQDHETHQYEHAKILKSVAFRSWPDYRREAFLQHVGEHEKISAEAQQSAQQSMLQQEQALRQIRASIETQQDVRTALGEELVKALMSALGVTKEPPKSRSK